MTFPLIATKLLIPKPRPELVTRPVLLERISIGLAGKFTLISASSGYGKTTLITEWYVKRGSNYPITPDFSYDQCKKSFF